MLRNAMSDNTQTSRVYLSSSTKMWKVGETAQRVSQRMSELRKTDKDIKWVIYFEFNGNKNLRLVIESMLKMVLVNNEYENVGNDHFTPKGEFEKFEQCFVETVTTILTDLKIGYTIRYNEKMG